MRIAPILILSLVLLPACSRPGTDPDNHSDGDVTQAEGKGEARSSAADLAIEELEAEYEELENAEEKVAKLEEFLDRHPDTEHTKGAVRELARVLTRELERPDEARARIAEAVAQTRDDDRRRYLEMELAIHYAGTGALTELTELTDAMAREYEFQFTDHYKLMEAGTEAEAWELVIEQADAALAYATPAAYKAQYPDMTDEEAARNGSRRVAYAMAFKGWALANLDRADEAVTVFSEALPNAAYSLLGADETPLHLYWGRSLLATGDAEAALEKLAVEAIHGLHEEGAEVFRDAWVEARGGEEGLEEHLWQLRLEHAVEMPTFALPDYDGGLVDTTRFAGDVLLVAAWHPT